MDNFFRKPDETTIPVVGEAKSPIPACMLTRAPVLGAYMTADAWPNGVVREHSSLIILVQDGMFKVCLSDKSTNMSLWSSCKSFDEVLEAVECRLTDESPDWRKQRPYGKKR